MAYLKHTLLCSTEETKKANEEMVRIQTMKRELGLLDGGSDDEFLGGEEEEEEDETVKITNEKMASYAKEVELLKASITDTATKALTCASNEREVLRQLEEIKINTKRATAVLQSGLKTKLEKYVSFIEDAMDILREWSDKLKSKQVDVEPEIMEELESKYASLGISISEASNAEENISAQEKANIELKTKVDSLKQINDSLERENAALRSGVDTFNKCSSIFAVHVESIDSIKKSKHDSIVSDKDKSILKLQMQLKDAEKKIDKLKRTIKEGSSTSATTSPTNAAGTPPPLPMPSPQSAPFQAVSGDVSIEVSTLRKENEDLVALIDEAQIELDRLSRETGSGSGETFARMVALTKENVDLTRLVKSLHSKLQSSKSSVGGDAKLQSKLKKSMRDNKELLNLLEEAQKEITSLQTALLSNGGSVPSPPVGGQNPDTEKLIQENRELLSLLADAEAALSAKEAGGASSSSDSSAKVVELENTISALTLELSTKEEKLMETMVEELEATEKRYKSQESDLRAEIASLKENLVKAKAQSSISAKLQSMVLTTHRKTAGLRDSMNIMTETVASQLEEYINFSNNVKKSIMEQVKSQKSMLGDIVEKYAKEKAERKRLFNLVQELRGNIRVYCRVRPASATELADGHTDVHNVIDDNELTLMNTAKGRLQQWEFDKVFGPSKNNGDIYEEVDGLITSVLDGYNVCIFAYGQTGSGKTFTMEGIPENRGINYRSLQMLFKLSQARSDEVVDTFKISIMEVYNEQLRDLLSKDHLKKLEVRGDEKRGTSVPDAECMTVKSLEDVINVCKLGYENRTSASTNMNEHSSRSHCLLALYVTSYNKISKVETTGKMYLIDLAGSERIGKTGATGQQLEEAKNINKSLSALGDVIAARANKQAHIPFRNSVLTHMLTSALSGDSKTLMFVNISPVSYNVEESVCSLNFASRVRKVELGMAEKNVKSPTKKGT
jgi:kinesin family protein C2/C3